MAHETVDYRDRIIRDGEAPAGRVVVKGSRVPVERVLARLAATLDVGDVLQDHPELTRDDVQAVLSYARDRILHDEPTPSPEVVSPQDFYAEITRRPDVSDLLRRLAR